MASAAHRRSRRTCSKYGTLSSSAFTPRRDRVLTRHVLDIKFAYVVFNEHRQAHLQNLVDYLESRDIFTAGRYGCWDYYSMEDSILSGKAAAEKVQAKIGSFS